VGGIEKGISISELCRQKLRDDIQLDRIEGKLERGVVGLPVLMWIYEG